MALEAANLKGTIEIDFKSIVNAQKALNALVKTLESLPSKKTINVSVDDSQVSAAKAEIKSIPSSSSLKIAVDDSQVSAAKAEISTIPKSRDVSINVSDADFSGGGFGGGGSLGGLDFGGLSSGISGLAGLAGALAAAGAAAVNASLNFSNLAIEIEKGATLASVSTEEYQRLEFAGQELGLSQGQLADIIKDVNDRVGDFILTGGGEFKQVFEGLLKPIGITTEQLRELGGEEVLGLVSRRIEELNLSASEQTFIFEALANNSTALAAALANGSEELNNLKRAADDRTAIITDDEIETAKEARGIIQEWGAAYDSAKNSAVNFFNETLVAREEFNDAQDEAIADLLRFVGVLDELPDEPVISVSLTPEEEEQLDKILEAKQAEGRAELRAAIGGDKSEADKEKELKKAQQDRINRLRQLQALAATEEERLDFERLIRIEQISQSELINEQEKAAGKLKIESDYQAALVELQNKRLQEAEKARQQELALEQKFFSERLSLLGQSQEDQLAALELQRRQRIADLASFETLTEQEKADAKLAINEQYLQQVSELEAAANIKSLSQVEGVFDSISRVGEGTGNQLTKSIGEIGAAAAQLAQLSISIGQSQVLSDPKIPWYTKVATAIGFAASAASLFTGLPGFSAPSGSGGSSSSFDSSAEAPSGADASGVTNITQPPVTVTVNTAYDPITDEQVADIMTNSPRVVNAQVNNISKNSTQFNQALGTA